MADGGLGDRFYPCFKGNWWINLAWYREYQCKVNDFMELLCYAIFQNIFFSCMHFQIHATVCERASMYIKLLRKVGLFLPLQLPQVQIKNWQSDISSFKVTLAHTHETVKCSSRCHGKWQCNVMTELFYLKKSY